MSLLYRDNFATDASSDPLAGSWSPDVSAPTLQLETLSGKCQCDPTAVSGFYGIAVYSGNAPNDGYMQVTIGNFLAADAFVALDLYYRMQTPFNTSLANNNYNLAIFYNGSGYTAQLLISGNSPIYSVLVNHPVANDVFKVTWQGSQHTLFRNGVQIAQGTDSTFSKGGVGTAAISLVIDSAATDLQLTDFQIGNFAAAMTTSILGFAPSYYYTQNTQGAGIWVASGTFNGKQINGQLVSFYSAGTYYIGFDSNGNLLTGSSSNMPYLIAQVVVGQVITSGNLPTNTPFGGAKNPINASTLANVQYSLGILSITDMRNF